MKRISGIIMIMGAINVTLSLLQGFLIPEELQSEFSTSARDYFLISAVTFLVGLKMNQSARRLENL